MIDDYHFGSITIDGKIYNEDVSIGLDGKVSSWWRKASHQVEREDIEKVLEKKPEIAVIGTGAYGLAEVLDEARNFITSQGAQLIVEKTAQAVERYNGLVKQGKKVAAFFHLTC